MTTTVPVDDRIERIVVITVDCLRWEYHEPYRDLYPNGVWYRGTTQATYTPTAHASLFTGLNPPRHGVYAFGDEYQGEETLLSATESASASAITDDGAGLVNGLEPGENVEFDFSRWFPARLDDSDGDSTAVPGPEEYRENVRQFGDYDLVFLHDWLLHKTEASDSSDWSFTADQSGDPEFNHRQYRRQLALSGAAHEQLLATIQEMGLYENTLFVLWGDHGQALTSDPFGELAHSHFPEECVARVPIAFCSPLFENDSVDVSTNARAIDVLPTIETIASGADVPMDQIPHEYEGVDLTEFEGELAGYTMGGRTAGSGFGDGVRTSEQAYLSLDTDETLLLETRTSPDPEDGYRLQRRIDNPVQKAKLAKLYEEVRREESELVHRREPDTEWLEAMGYL
ncbi:alkaline phosphatase family protein [Halorussus halophilus]|uniref:alkaline phosphatase family protein n=1 Tax=Halorussus halophilus TaxID=2650975 RepID=UPI001301463D|nr:alkaline phosphatase family protein [Halorussus halophilus]